MKKSQHEAIVKYMKWLDKFSYEVMSDSSIKFAYNDFVKPLFFSQIVKLHTSFGGTLELVKKGYGMDGMIIVRNMLNNLISCKWIINSKPKTRAKRFIGYDSVLRKRYLDIAKKYPEQQSHFLKVLAEEKQIISSYEKVEKVFVKDKYSWSGKKIREMAEEVGLEWDYDFIYRLASSLEHSDINSLSKYIEGIDHVNKQLTFKGGPTPIYIMESGITAIKYMGEGVELFVKVFKLNKNYQKRLLRFAARVSSKLKRN